MNTEDLKEQLLEKWEELKSQLDDSAAFNTLKEKFENLSPGAQKGVIWSGVFVFSLTLFSCPYGYWSESGETLVEFEDTRDMMRDLLKASHLAGQTANIPQPLDMGNLTSRVESVLSGARILPEQKVSVTPTEVASLGTPLAPPSIEQEALEVHLKKLNLEQVVDIGYRFQDLHQTVKLAGFEMGNNPEDDHYFDVKYKILKFSLPQEPKAEEEKPGDRNRRRPPNRRRGGQ